MGHSEQPILVDFALADLSLWIQRGLNNLKHRTVYERGDQGGAATNGYAVAEFPDWDLRQKIDLIESAKNDAIRILDLNHRLVECLKEAMAQTGCDGDLCLYRWHETARQILREAEDSIAASPRKDRLREAADVALKLLTGSDLEYALVDYPDRPNYTICDQLREALGLPAQDRSDW